jgi:hypothetical protein
MTKKAIQGADFPGVFLRLAGQGVTDGNSSGGVVNCQFGVGPFETFDLQAQPGGTFSFASTAFPNVYLRVDGRGLTSPRDGGGGAVNAQFDITDSARFRLEPRDNGTVAIGSVSFPNVYLRMDGSGVTQSVSPGGGTVNAQYTAGEYERFYLIDLYESQGKGNACALFDTRGNQALAPIRVPAHADLALTAPFTLEAWVMWDGWRGYCTVLNRPGPAGTAGVELAILTGDVFFEIWLASSNGTVKRTGGTLRKRIIPIGAWTHLCASYDGKRQTVYVNGVRVDQKDGTAGNPVAGTNSPLLIGGRTESSSDGSRFHGLVSNVRVWNAVLPGDLIKVWSAVDDLSSHPMRANLMGYWRLNELSGNIFYDATWRGHDGQGDVSAGSSLKRIVYDGGAWMSSNRRFILLRDGGLAIDAGAGTQGTAVLLQTKEGFSGPGASRQLWSFEAGRIIHAASGLALDCSVPGNVNLQPRSDGKAAQAWFFDRENGLVTSPGAPGKVLRPTAHGTGYVLMMGADTPLSAADPIEARRWLFLAALRRRPLINLSNNRVLTADAPGQLADFNPTNDAHYWYDLFDRLISDKGGTLTIANPGLGGATLSCTPLGQGIQRFVTDSSNPGWIRVTSQELTTLFLAVDGNVAKMKPARALDLHPEVTHWSRDANAGWILMPGEFMDLSVGIDGFVGVLTRSGVPLYAAGGGKWRRFPSPPPNIVGISVGGANAVWVLDRSARVFRYRGGDFRIFWVKDQNGQLYRSGASSGPWEEMGGNRSFKELAATATGSVWGIDNNNKVVRYDGSAWREVPTAPMAVYPSHISAGNDDDVWAVAGAGEVWNYRPDTGAWRLVPGQMRSVSVGGDGTVWGVAADSSLFRYQGSVANTWQAVPGKMLRCAVGADGIVWAQGFAGELYQYAAQ